MTPPGATLHTDPADPADPVDPVAAATAALLGVPVPLVDSSVPHAQILALPADQTCPDPDGAVQIGWTDAAGGHRCIHIVHWWRLDPATLPIGTTLHIGVHARQHRHLGCPTHHVTAALTVTGDLTDVAHVFIGDPHRPGSWAYGLVLTGARPATDTETEPLPSVDGEVVGCCSGG